MFTEPKLFQALELWWNRKNIPELAEGRIDTVGTDGLAWVVPNSGSTAQQAIFDKRTNASLAAGDFVLLARASRTSRWVIVSAYGAPSRGRNVASGTGQINDLGIPTDFHSKSIPGLGIWQWNTTPHTDLTFELQLTTSLVTIDDVIQVITRGSYFAHNFTSIMYARIRSVNKTFQRSGWSEWVSCNPGVASISSSLMQSVVISVDLTINVDFQYIVYQRLEILPGVNVTVNGEIVVL